MCLPAGAPLLGPIKSDIADTSDQRFHWRSQFENGGAFRKSSTKAPMQIGIPPNGGAIRRTWMDCSGRNPTDPPRWQHQTRTFHADDEPVSNKHELSLRMRGRGLPTSVSSRSSRRSRKLLSRLERFLSESDDWPDFHVYWRYTVSGSSCNETK
jgi:hypothetical protein